MRNPCTYKISVRNDRIPLRVNPHGVLSTFRCFFHRNNAQDIPHRLSESRKRTDNIIKEGRLESNICRPGDGVKGTGNLIERGKEMS